MDREEKMCIFSYYAIPMVIITVVVIIIMCKINHNRRIIAGVMTGGVIGGIIFFLGVLCIPCSASIRIYHYFYYFLWGAIIGGIYGLFIAVIYKMIEKLKKVKSNK